MHQRNRMANVIRDDVFLERLDSLLAGLRGGGVHKGFLCDLLLERTTKDTKHTKTDGRKRRAKKSGAKNEDESTGVLRLPERRAGSRHDFCPDPFIRK